MALLFVCDLCGWDANVDRCNTEEYEKTCPDCGESGCTSCIPEVLCDACQDLANDLREEDERLEREREEASWVPE